MRVNSSVGSRAIVSPEGPREIAGRGGKSKPRCGKVAAATSRPAEEGYEGKKTATRVIN
jgi:hypothetical protein